MNGKCVNCLEVGCRVWEEYGLDGHGHEKVNVPARTGGIVVSIGNNMDNALYTIEWDTGQRSVHYANTLCAIGNARNLSEFEAAIMAAAVRGEIIFGPNGGHRGATIFLRDGDWIDGMYGLQPQLEAARIPIEIKHLERRKPPPRSPPSPYGEPEGCGTPPVKRLPRMRKM